MNVHRFVGGRRGVPAEDPHDRFTGNEIDVDPIAV